MVNAKGKELLKRGYALMDISNRTKQINEKSAIALASQKIKFTVLIKSSEKKKVFKKLEKAHDKGRVSAIVQSAKIFYALKDHIDLIPGVYICSDGHNPSQLKYYLKQFLGHKYNEEKIIILQSLKPLFGKKNIADRAAHHVARENGKPSLELKEEHFEKLGLIKKIIRARPNGEP